MTHTKKAYLKVLPYLKNKAKPKSRSKSPPKNGAANGRGAFNNQNMPPNNPRLSRSSR